MFSLAGLEVVGVVEAPTLLDELGDVGVLPFLQLADRHQNVPAVFQSLIGLAVAIAKRVQELHHAIEVALQQEHLRVFQVLVEILLVVLVREQRLGTEGIVALGLRGSVHTAVGASWSQKLTSVGARCLDLYGNALGDGFQLTHVRFNLPALVFFVAESHLHAFMTGPIDRPKLGFGFVLINLRDVIASLIKDID